MTLEQIRELAGGDAFAAIDLVFADFILRQAHSDSAELYLAAALASFAVRAGNSCCDLRLYAAHRFPESSNAETDDAPSIEMPSLDTWLQCLRAPAFRTSVSLYPEQDDPDAPLVLDKEGRLYLNRYFMYEKQLAEQILRRCAVPPKILPLEPHRLADISPWFRIAAQHKETDFQQAAVFLALQNRFSVITGGPGTGKTTVAAALLALELERDPELEAVLCAPTGKAQARLKEAVSQGIDSLSCPQKIKGRLAALPCGTIHSILHPIPGTTRFRHNAQNPLSADLIIVDEASMVSLSLMAKLLKAIRPDAKIVLLGDKDQLASVDAGAVLADICGCGKRNVMRKDAAEAFRTQTGWTFPQADHEQPLSGHIAELAVNHRSADAPTVSRFSATIRDISTGDDLKKLAAEIAHCSAADFRTCSLPRSNRIATALREEIDRPCIRLKNEETKPYALSDLRGLARQGGITALRKAFGIIDGFKILCALRSGPVGVRTVNAMIRAELGMTEVFACGMPVMITRNSPDHGFFNGDIGLIWQDPDTGKRRVFFPDPGSPDGFRSCLPAELPEHEPAFAMTVHKSQGSGFQNVLILLPGYDSPILTRELLYTAVTRAEKHVTLWANHPQILFSLEHLTVRQSGLKERLETDFRSQNTVSG